MKLLKERFYKINMIILSLVGQWPYQDPKIRSLYRFVACFVYLSFLEVQIVKLITSEYDVDLIVEILPNIFGTMVCATKYLTCWVQIEIIRHLLEQLELDWTVLKNKAELDILRKCAETGATYEIYYICCSCFVVLAFVMIPFVPSILDVVIPLNESRSYYIPFKAEYFIDQEKYFYAILIHMDASVLVVITTLIASDVTATTVVMHASGTLDVLGYRLEHYFDDMNEEDHDDDLKNLSYRKICDCIKYHIKIIEYIRTIKHCYSSSAVIQLMFAVSTTTLVLLRLFQNFIHRNYGEVIICCIHMGGHLFGVFMNILPAQKLLDYSGDIYYRAYFGHWYYAPVQTQKLLLLIMQKAKEPYGITIAGILISSYELFTAIVHTSVSYFTVIYSIR